MAPVLDHLSLWQVVLLSLVRKMERLNTHEAAKFLGLSYWTLIKWRSLGKGPPWVKLGSRVRYPLAGLHQYLADNTFGLEN